MGKKQEHLHLRYRDNLTEGYNITPNFFIQGYISRIERNAKIMEVNMLLKAQD